MPYSYVVAGSAVIVTTSFILGKALSRKHAIVGKYEYLQLLHSHMSKPLHWIKEEMETLKGGWLSDEEVNQALASLEDEDLVKREIINFGVKKLETHCFKLTSQGEERRDSLIKATQAPLGEFASNYY